MIAPLIEASEQDLWIFRGTSETRRHEQKCCVVSSGRHSPSAQVEYLRRRRRDERGEETREERGGERRGRSVSTDVCTYGRALYWTVRTYKHQLSACFSLLLFSSLFFSLLLSSSLFFSLLLSKSHLVHLRLRVGLEQLVVDGAESFLCNIPEKNNEIQVQCELRCQALSKVKLSISQCVHNVFRY